MSCLYGTDFASHIIHRLFNPVGPASEISTLSDLSMIGADGPLSLYNSVEMTAIPMPPGAAS
ncbi:MAG: hypothetical protein AB7S77_01340 [Desulfatirhabdiaceae bacterium]